MRITQELIYYIEQMDKYSKKLSKKQKKQLETIFTVILQLLIALKRDSYLGKTIITLKK